MKICLVRHGKPAPVPGKSVNAEGFGRWLREFDAAGLDSWERPPKDMVHKVCDCRAVVTSPLERAHSSARLLFPGRSVLVEASLREFGLPSAPLPLVRLQPGTWVALCRALWFAGYSRGAENITDARARAAKGAELLVRLAAHNDSVAFVGHGLINTFLARELKRLGWQGPSIPDRHYWGVAVYRCGLQPIKGREAIVKGPRVRVPKPETV